MRLSKRAVGLRELPDGARKTGKEFDEETGAGQLCAAMAEGEPLRVGMR